MQRQLRRVTITVVAVPDDQLPAGVPVLDELVF